MECFQEKFCFSCDDLVNIYVEIGRIAYMLYLSISYEMSSFVNDEFTNIKLVFPVITAASDLCALKLFCGCFCESKCLKGS